MSGGTLKIDKNAHSTTLSPSAWAGGVAFYNIDGQLVALDVANRAVAYRWP